MSDSNPKFREVSTSGPQYLGWRAELLTKLALSRLGGLSFFETSQNEPYDFVVATSEGSCFFVEVKAFSSIRLNMSKVDKIQELRWRIPSKLLAEANRSRNPFILFLFDADTDHGRFLRLDSIPPTMNSARFQTIRLPISNTITEKTLRALVSELRS